MEDPYFDLPPPKSTGRELFNLDWLSRGLEGRSIEPQDVQASLTRLTAASAAAAIERCLPAAADVLVCGGGARNSTLMAMLTEACGGRPVRSVAAAGVEPEHVEALAFAWLARAHVLRTAGNLPSVTGARGTRVLGALYPAR
jgi:anhydro-N-acetylmuramic acid kinase